MNEAEVPARGFEAEYNEEVTRETYKELERLALWAAGTGPRFYLIGGWAAWYYHQGLGSRDIDVVFPDRYVLDVFLHQYYKQNQYETYGGLLDKRYRKRIDVDGKTAFVVIDAASIRDGPPFKEDKERNIPFSELENHSRVWGLGKVDIAIPSPELLILQKIKAWRDRTWDLENTATTGLDVAYLQSKIWKDEYDIKGLSQKIGDWKTVQMIAEAYDCIELARDALTQIGMDPRF